MFPLVVALVLHQKFPIGKMLRFSIALLSHLLRGGFLLFCKLHRYVLSVLISYAKDLVCSEYYLYINYKMYSTFISIITCNVSALTGSVKFLPRLEYFPS